MRATPVDAVLLGKLVALQNRNKKWVCVGTDPHGHTEPPMRSGRPQCPCGANSFVRIDEAIRRVSNGHSLMEPRAA